jgi:hypothetical protein
LGTRRAWTIPLAVIGLVGVGVALAQRRSEGQAV